MKGTILLRTQITPDITYGVDASLAPSQAPPPVVGGGGSEGVVSVESPFSLSGWFLRNVVRPELVVSSDAGDLVRYAPYGKPTANYFPLLMLLGGVGAYYVGRTLWRGLKAGSQ